ncbi:hypothetical protein CDD83_5090 [Cordyceps sp. RAO-2017]|nr:hypothetical protein CDD83_5090 [Cordyceps sp. RAO-2017]
MTAPPQPPRERHCLVTVGATVGFAELVRHALEPAFWAFLRAEGFGALRVQCGPDAGWARARLAERRGGVPPGLDVDVFDVKSDLVRDEMALCRAAHPRQRPGVVISHAGTGTILDAWKLGVPLIVVPNTQLLDDHQTQMAKHLAKEGYATMASPT